MKSLFTSLAVIALVLLTACNSDEKLIDNTVDDWNILVATAGAEPKVYMKSLPDGAITSPDIISQYNGFTLKSPVTKIAESGGRLYLFVPGDYKLIVLNNTTFKVDTVFDFTSDQTAPTDICFMPNGTAAYIAHGGNSSVTLLDTYYMKLTLKIKVGRNPAAIACSGNQVLVTNQLDNTVSVIDSRTNEVTATLDVFPNPAYIGFAANGKDAVVVSLGLGKLNTSDTKTPAVASFIDIEQSKVTKYVEIGTTTYKSADQYPRGLAVSPGDWGFIPCDDVMFKVDTKRQDRVLYVSRPKYSYIYYNRKRGELICLKNESGKFTLVTGNKSSGAIIKSYPLESEVTALFAL